MRLILLGPPGAGKGTQAVLLGKRFKLIHISTGDMLRIQIKKKDKLSQRLRSFMEKGQLVPDEIVTEIIKLRLQKKDIKNGFMLDGFPRTRIQAEALDNMLLKKRLPIDATIYFEASNKVIIQRLSGRRVCSKCGANFHIKNMPPKKDMICDGCGADLYKRKDDAIPTIKNRILVYLKQSKPLINYYLKQDKLTSVDADCSAEVVFLRLKKLFAKRGLI